MRNKTRILVTHELSYLKYANLILIMADGKIVSEGSYTELMQTGALAKLVKECKTEQELVGSNQKEIDDLDDYISDDPDETFVDDNNTVDDVLGTSALSTVSGIVLRRRYSNITKKHRRRLSTTKSVISTEVSNRQLTGSEKVETGRVKIILKYYFF